MLGVIGLFEGILSDFDIEQMVISEQLFDQFTYSDHTLSLNELIGVKEFENDEKASKAFEIYYFHVRRILGMLGVIPSVEVTHATANEMLEAMLSIDSPDNTDILDEVLSEESENSMWILAGIIAELSDLTRTDVMEALEEVDGSMVRRLKELSNDSEVKFEIIETTRVIRHDFLKLMQDRKNGPVYEEVIKAEQFPMPKVPLIEAVSKTITNMTDDDLIAEELLGIMVVTDTPKDEMIRQALELRETLLPVGNDAVDGKLEAKFKELYNE